MVRPRGFESDQVAQGLLDAFWLHGYARTSIPTLTAATGLLPGSLYGAFGSKDEMFRVAVERYVAEIRQAVTTTATGVAAIQRVLDTIVRLTAKDPDRRGCLILNAIPESAPLSAATRRVLQDGLDEMRRLLRTHLREAERDAGVTLDVAALEALCFAAAVSIRVLGRAGQSRRLLQDIANGATGAVCRALEG